MTDDTTFAEKLNIRDAWVLPVLLSLAFMVRIYLGFHTYVITNDGFLYVKLAKLISAGKFGEAISLHTLSLFPIMIALFQKVLINWEFSGQMVSALFGSLAIIPFYFLIKRLFSKDIALISSLFFTLHPYLVRFSAEVIKEPTFWFFLLGTLWIGWEALTRKKTMAVCSDKHFGNDLFPFENRGHICCPLHSGLGISEGCENMENDL